MKKKTNKKLLSFITGSLIAINTLSVINTIPDQYLKSKYSLTSSTIINSSTSSSISTFMNETTIKVPIKDAMVPQGLTKTTNQYLISSYDYNHEKNSTISICDSDGEFTKECSLDIRAHVGGIAYDAQNDLIWVAANNGEVNAYSYQEIILSKDEAQALYSFNVGKGCQNYIYPWKKSISYLAIDKNYLYVGSFSLAKNGLIKKYLIENENDTINLTLQHSFKVPTKVQGVAIYHKNNQDYIIFSRSFGEKVPSILQIFKYQDEIDDYTSPQLNSVCYETNAMMEQIIIDKNHLYTLFESSAAPYCYDSVSSDNLETTNMSLVLLPK